MQVNRLFNSATQHFQTNAYQEGLEEISKCIQILPINSALYSNRALFHSQLGDIDAAVEDLLKAVNFNYLNYVAYFNLFSLQFNSGQVEDAFDNLCCGLSCLYLVRAKRERRELDVQRSIKYAQNNPQAHILKALMYLQDGKNKLALNEIEWALDLQIHVATCIKIKNIINRKINPYAVNQSYNDTQDTVNFRLHTTYQPSQSYDEEIPLRVRQFNEIYEQVIGSQSGAFMQRIPRIMGSRLNQSQSSDTSDIYAINYKDDSQQSKQKSSQPPTKEDLPNQNNESILLLQRNHEQTSLDYAHKNINNHNNEEEDNIFENEDSLNPFTKEYQEEIQQQEVVLNTINHTFKINQKSLTQVQPFLSDEDLLLETHPYDYKEEEKSQIINASEVSSNNEPVNLYPIQQDHKKIQLTIISAQLKIPISKAKDLYIAGNYNSKKGQMIKTPNRRADNNLVQWFTSTPPTDIAESRSTLSLALYSKQYFSYDNELIGEGEIQILKSGEMKFPLYQKGGVTAFISMRVDLI